MGWVNGVLGVKVDEEGVPWGTEGETVEREMDPDCELDTKPESTMSGEALDENVRFSEGMN